MGKKFWIFILMILIVGFSVGYFIDEIYFSKNKVSEMKRSNTEEQIKRKFEEKRELHAEPFVDTPIMVTDRRNEKMELSDEEQNPVVNVVKKWVLLKYNVDYETLTQEQFNEEISLFTTYVQENVQVSEYEQMYNGLQKSKYRSFIEGFQIKSIQFTLDQDSPAYLVTVLADVYQAQNESLASLTYTIQILVDQKEKKIRDAKIIKTDLR